MPCAADKVILFDLMPGRVGLEFGGVLWLTVYRR